MPSSPEDLRTQLMERVYIVDQRSYGALVDGVTGVAFHVRSKATD
jgi:hypothetical protein